MKSLQSHGPAKGRNSKSAKVSGLPGFSPPNYSDRAEGEPASPEVVGGEHQEWVATAAYFLAERRGFTAGAELEDWLAAEAQIRALHQQ